MDKLKKKILKAIANHSIFSYQEIEKGYNIAKSFDILIEAMESAPKLNISLEMAIMSSSVK